jgi:hypothetical protein
VCFQEPLLPRETCTRYVERNQDQYVNCGEWLLAALSVKVRNSYMQFSAVPVYTVKKGSRVSRFQPGCHKPNSPWAGIIQL